MIKIRKTNFLTDCYRDYALDIHAILTAVYETSPWTFEQTFADMLLETTAYYLAFSDSDGKLVGFLATSTVMDETEITNIAVLTGFQGQGIASRLMQQLATSDGTIFLEVRASNLAAQKLYEKCGFVAYYQRKDYYQNPSEDAILMRREN
ncbi:ribosomal protein S18-alanine N-acetyltransferase [Pseudolactococcus insecticola]|uniref:[Ribosomal protein bS18]-alanine N-acetyltransferase n=1 Tax=Pseudolactococcus insecticola TaxID=2709158 RepID=A0A6A0B7P3_9LACT|nr:ribosomal protein S18-alanine N-acetyltransferase [Lactococcus insecticola]GFH40673.1 ribosomal-protein-alanine acetyltransferase [Lactococcus insecticola]